MASIGTVLAGLAVVATATPQLGEGTPIPVAQPVAEPAVTPARADDLQVRVAALMRQGQCNEALAAAFRAGDMALVSRVRMGCR